LAGIWEIFEGGLKEQQQLVQIFAWSSFFGSPLEVPPAVDWGLVLLHVCSKEAIPMVVSQKTPRRVSFPVCTPRKGELGTRVEAVGPKRFGVVAIDCAKNASRWRLADFYGRCLIPPTTLPHRAADFEAAIQAVKQAVSTHEIADLVVVVERTGRYHLIVKKALEDAGFEVRVIDPLATHQFRKPVHAGNKTDDTDLEAIHDAAVHGLGLLHRAAPAVFQQLQDWARHRRDLVEKNSRLRCQIREHLHAAMPGYAELFNDVFNGKIGLFVPLHFTIDALRAARPGPLADAARAAGVRCHRKTLDAILAWAKIAPRPDDRPEIRRAILTDLIADFEAKERQIAQVEITLAQLLTETPYLVLLSIPGLNVVTAAEFAAEAGPITAYAKARAITGRAGLYPSRYQSGAVDRADGPLVPRGNRRLRQAILRIADTLMRCNDHFRIVAQALRLRGMPGPKIHIAIGNRFSRIAYKMAAGNQVYRHPSGQEPDYILWKLMTFYENHRINPTDTRSRLQTAVENLPESVRDAEARSLSEELTRIAGKRGTGAQRLAEILPSVLARLSADALKSAPSGELSQPL
jgi:transposase